MIRKKTFSFCFFLVFSTTNYLPSKIHGLQLDDNPLLAAARRSSSIKKLDECFCELSGPVDVCCCDVETVDTLNHNHVYPLITELISRTFFRFFKINLSRACPFWSDDGRCVLRNCHVEVCTEEEVPTFLKGSNTSVVSSCDEVSAEEVQLSLIVMPDKVSDEQQSEFKEWSRLDDNFCQLEDDFSDEGSYIDLVLNPERYTGYSGHSPHRIWSAIYDENCFKDHTSQSYDIYELCLEKRAFYRLISGLHASISIHLSAQYIISGGLSESPKFGPNLSEFVKRFDTVQSNGQGPGWLKNLYFAYLVVLRSVIKAENIWNLETFRTLNKTEDTIVRDTILKIAENVKGCGQNLFDESQMFNSDASRQLKEEFRTHFRNISSIMDCVGCDKCKLWGKVQTQGIGTALKILFNGNSAHDLVRSEIVSLFNVLGRLSESIEYLQMFKIMASSQQQQEHSKNSQNKIEL